MSLESLREDALDWPFPRTEEGTPPPILEELRRKPPTAVRIPEGATSSRLAWLVTRYEDVRTALSHPLLSADETRPGAPVRIQLPPGERPSSYLRMDDPEHGRLRGLIQKEFTARRVRGLEDDVNALTEHLLDEFAALPQPADLHDAFSRRLPTLVIGRLLGVAESDYTFFIRTTQVVIAQDDPAAAYDAYLQMTAYLQELAERKLKEPTDDLVSRLVPHVESGEITMSELVGIALLVLVAGHETTTNQIALNILSLLGDDELRERVAADDGALVPQFVEESVRYWSISQDAILRQAIEDVEVGGVVFAAGDAVVISIPAGNHDERVFGCPHKLDIDRDAGGHLQWGYGPHFCQGKPLAQMEMAAALRALLRRFPNLRLAAESRTLFRRETVFHGVTSLPVTW
ncbi:cytochrome P450 [Streptomyces sp. NPDC101733]|uniref:cytochrome P450 n=1 Tax=unclassified Streptomyces TaxID=2593676 RepID=UPI003817A17A